MMLYDVSDHDSAFHELSIMKFSKFSENTEGNIKPMAHGKSWLMDYVAQLLLIIRAASPASSSACFFLLSGCLVVT